jgi:hypothetical protein
LRGSTGTPPFSHEERSMSEAEAPRPFSEWRTDSHRRAEDAAYTFGSHLMQYCRAEAIKVLGSSTEAAVTRTQAEKAIDTALHNVMDLLEGFFGPLQAGTGHRVEYALSVLVKDDRGNAIERVDVSPCMLDLPIGYWKWKDGEFR